MDVGGKFRVQIFLMMNKSQNLGDEFFVQTGDCMQTQGIVITEELIFSTFGLELL